MKLYLLRHGDANWQDWKQSDAERPLTKKGNRQAKAVGKALAQLDVMPLVILTSPLPRALQTAERVAEALDVRAQTEPELAPGFDRAKLAALLAQYPQADLMLVGHNPDLSDLARELTGAVIRLPTAGLVQVELDSATARRGTLNWLVPAKIFKTL